MVKLARIIRTEYSDEKMPKPSPYGRRGQHITTNNSKATAATTPPSLRKDAPAGNGVVAAAVGAIEGSISPTTNQQTSGLLNILQNNMGATAVTPASVHENDDEQRDPVETFAPIVIDPIKDPHLYALTRAAQLSAQKAAQNNRDPPPTPKAAAKKEAPTSTNGAAGFDAEQSPVMPKEETMTCEKREQPMLTMAMLSGEVEDGAFSDALQSMLGDGEGDEEKVGFDKETESKLNETLQKCAPDSMATPLKKNPQGLTVNTCLSADDAVAVTTTTPANKNNTAQSGTPTMANTSGGFGQINKTRSSTSHQHQHSSPSQRNLFKQRRGGRKEKAERRKAEKAAKKMAQEASKKMTQEAMKMVTKAAAATIPKNGGAQGAPGNVINLVYSTKKNSSAAAEAEMRRKEAAQADIELARNAVAQKLQQQRKEQQQQKKQQKEDEKKAAAEEKETASALQHKNKYKHIAQIEPQMRIVQVATSQSAEEGFEEGLSFHDTMSGSLSGSFSYSGDDGDSDESDSDDDSDSDSDISEAEDKKCVLGTPKNADTLFELESNLSGSTWSSSSLSSSSSSIISDDDGSLSSFDEEDSLAHDDEEDSLVNTIVGGDPNDDDTLVDTIVDGNDTVCNADDTIVGDGATDDDLFLTDGGDTDFGTSADEDDDSEEEVEEVAFFASFCQRPEDSSFDLLDEGDYNPRKDGKYKTRRYRAKKESVLDVTEVPSLLKCVSGYFVGEVHAEKPKKRKASSRRRYRS